MNRFPILMGLLPFLVSIYGVLHAQEGEKFYWYEDWTSNHAGFLEKFSNENLPKWTHARSRIDGYVVRRGSAVALNGERRSNSTAWQDFSREVPKLGYEGGLNSGLMNNSWEFDTREKFISRFSGDLGPITSFRDAGFSQFVMFMQSPLSKGPSVEFTEEGGATLEQRIQDCLDYAEYITDRKPDGIEVTFALIDAFTQKNTFGDRSVYRDAYRDLVLAFNEAGYPFEGFIFDAKTSWVMNNVDKVMDDAEYIVETISQETGIDLYAGWYTWTNANSEAKANSDIELAMSNIEAHPKSHYLSRLWVAGNQEKGPHFPDYINGLSVSRLERLNQIYCLLEDMELNPLQAGDPILHPGIIPMTYESWATSHGLTGLSGDDEDKDGTSNFLEYIFGGDPKKAEDPGAMPEFNLSDQSCQVRFRRRIDDSSLSYEITTSSDLEEWNSPTLLETTVLSTDGYIEDVVATIQWDQDETLFLKFTSESQQNG